MVEKLERQMSLLATLINTEQHLTAADIQRRVEGYPEDTTAFRRAFERDKKDLRDLGIPFDDEMVETFQGPTQGYRILHEDYYLHDLGLEPDERVALAMALRVIRLEGAATADDARWKLGGVALDDGVPSELASIAIDPRVASVQEAIGQGVAIRFTYRGDGRTVEPWGMYLRRGQWYVSGFDLDRMDSRVFRVDRIESTIDVLVSQPATHPKGEIEPDRQPWEFANEESLVAEVRVDASQAGWLLRRLGQASVVARDDDGAVTVQFDVRDRAGFRNLVLSMADGAEVVSPPELRAEIIDWLQEQR